MMALDDDDVAVLGGENGDEFSAVGVIAAASNVIVMFIAAAPGIKVMYRFRADEARLQAAIESTMAQSNTASSGGALFALYNSAGGRSRQLQPPLQSRITTPQQKCPRLVYRQSCPPMGTHPSPALPPTVALDHAHRVNVDTSPDTITPLVARIVKKTGGWLEASDGGVNDVWLPDAITDGLEGAEGEPILSQLPTDAAGTSTLPPLKPGVSGKNSLKALAVLYDEYFEHRKMQLKLIEDKLAAKADFLSSVALDHKLKSDGGIASQNIERAQMRRALLLAARDVQIVLGQAIDEFPSVSNIVKTCDATIEKTVEVLSPVYEAM